MRVILCAALLFAAACMRETGDLSQSGPSESTTVAPSSESGATLTSPMMPPRQADRHDDPSAHVKPNVPVQEVHLIEYAVHMPDAMRAGRVTFNVENGGKESHGFEIEGGGVHQASPLLSGGNSAAVTVELKPGTYTVYCPVKGHKERGMTRTVTVQ